MLEGVIAIILNRFPLPIGNKNDEVELVIFATGPFTKLELEAPETEPAVEIVNRLVDVVVMFP